MLSDILRKDIRQYAARGIAFEPADIVRLNALAVQVKLCQRPCQGVHLPRCVFLPPTSISIRIFLKCSVSWLRLWALLLIRSQSKPPRLKSLALPAAKKVSPHMLLP